MFNSIQTKIAVPVVGTLILLVIFIVIYVSREVNAFSRGLSEQRLQGAAQTAQAFLEQLERYNKTNARAVAGKDYMIRLVNEWNSGEGDEAAIRQGLFDRLHTRNIEFGIGYFMITEFTVTCRDGYVIMRTSDPERYGDTGMVSPTIRYAHQGRNETIYTVTDKIPMGLSSTAPIWINNEVIGTVSSVMILSNMDFVDEFGAIFNAEVTVFSGDTSLASTLRKEDGERAINTTADPRVVAAVLERGVPFDLELELFGSLHHAFYFPLIGWEGLPVGMFFVGFSVEEAISGTNSFIANIVLICVVGMCISAMFMLLGIHLNSKRVKHLAELMDKIASGGDYTEIYDVPVSEDEIGQLTKSLSYLAKTIGNLSGNKSVKEIKEDLEKAHHDAEKAILASKVKSDFLGRMSHEIRTPISAILGATEIQLRTAKGESKRAYEQIYSSGSMLMGLINDILDLSKIEAGKLSINHAKYEVASMLSDTIQLNMMHISSKPIQFEVSVNKEIPAELRGDELRIKQILNNVLSNAFKYTDEGLVKLSVGKVAYDTGQITMVFTVSDTGQGMTAQQVSTLFDEYTRFNHVANREAEGTGLGMAIAKMLVDMMGGHISVKSELNKGTIFTIKIPQKLAGETVLGKETAENISTFKYTSRKAKLQSEWENMSYGKVLIVDDISANVYVTKGLLAPYCLQIDSASSGFSAIDKIKKGAKYDLIFMDHMMPKMDGIETTKRLRTIGYNEPIVAFTANALVGQEEEFLQNGFDGFVSKPIQSTYLDSILTKFVRDKYPIEVREAANAKALPMPEIPSFNENRLYKDFVKSEENVMQEISDAVAKKDYKGARLLAHTLKSLAGLINEQSLMELASQAEVAFHQETYPFDLIKKLEKEVTAVLEAVKAKIVEESPLKQTDKKPTEIFITVETLLTERNAEVITMVPILDAMPDTEELVGHIENYNFDLALASLKKLTPR
ncbi:MAG: ATP-binding protein [Defluviitaleaceae bacterium]|nr:ATP-binding protein [Defluviitaleaceae bacterium]